MPERILISRDEAAALCGVSLSTFDRHVRQALIAKRIGSRVLFDAEDVRAWASSSNAARSDRVTPPTESRRRSTVLSVREAEIVERLQRRRAAYLAKGQR